MNGKNQRRRERRAFVRQLCDKINTFQADQIAEVLAIAANNESITVSLTKRYLLLLQVINSDVPFGLKHLEELPAYLQSFQTFTQADCYEFRYYFDMIGFYVMKKQISVATDLVRNYAPRNIQELEIQYCSSDTGLLFIGIAFYQDLAQTEGLLPLPDLNVVQISMYNTECKASFLPQTAKIESRHFSKLNTLFFDDIRLIQYLEPSHLVSLKTILAQKIKLYDILSFISLVPAIQQADLSITDTNNLPNLSSISLQRLTINAYNSPLPLPEIVLDFPNLPNLKEFCIMCSHVIYIGNIRPSAQLKKFAVSSAKIQDIDTISNFSQLEELRLSHLNLSDINFVKHLPNLKNLTLTANKIKDITPLSGLLSPNLLYLNDNNIEDISPLAGLATIKMLYLENNNIKDISPLSGLLALEYLNINKNKIEDITPLSGLKKLASLDCSDNRIDDITIVLSINPKMDLNAKNNKLTAFPSFELIRQIILQQKNRYKFRRASDPEIVLPPRPEPESAREIWDLLRTKDPANIELATQIAIGIGWQKEDLNPYLFIVNKWF